MALTVEKVTALSKALLAQDRPDIKVSGIFVTEGSNDRIELLLTIEGCHVEPCRLTVNIRRSSAKVFERELRAALQEHVARAIS